MKSKERLFLTVGRSKGAIHMSYKVLVNLAAMLLKLELKCQNGGLTAEILSTFVSEKAHPLV